MTASTLQWVRTWLAQVPRWGTMLLLVYMPLHIFLSQSLSLVTGGLEVWKVAKDIVLASLCLFTICIVWWQGKGTRLWWLLVAVAGGYAVLHGLAWAWNPHIEQQNAILGSVYNLRLPAFLLLGYGAVLLAPRKFAFSSIFAVVVGISTIVAILGIVQLFLPADFLTHFGYSLERGVRAAFFIDDQPGLPRSMSTLREPNALGAYLLLPIAVLTLYVMRRPTWRWQYMAGVLVLVVHIVALVCTQSRSAWLGCLLIGGWMAVWRWGHGMGTWLRRWWWLPVACMALLVFVGWQQRNSHFVQRYIIHSNPQETSADLDSNDYHLLLIREGLQGIVDRPQGHGPGTAGIISIRGDGIGQLTENYYIQIGYELGIVGMLLFVAGNVWLFVRLSRRTDTAGLVLCVTFGGYVVTNMLLHSWSNEAVAAQWWLLAGVALHAQALKNKTG